jgi:hypothetical protein
VSRSFEGTESAVIAQTIWEDGLEVGGNHVGTPSAELRTLIAEHAPKNDGAVA